MSASLDLYIDTATGELIQGGASVGGSLPTLTRNDSYTLRLRLLEKQPNGLYDDIGLSGVSLKAGIGEIEDPPSAGAFKLTCNGVTSDAIDYNASALAVYSAISNNVATVSLYGGEASAYLLTATQSNTAMSFSADTFTLFPSSTILIGTRRNPATGIAAQQTIRLIKNPIVYADTFVDAPTASELALTKLNDGSATQNETYELNIGSAVVGGSYALVFGTNATTGIPPGASAISVQTAISSGISTITSNCSVQENGKGGYIISFTGRLRLTDVTTPLTLDASGIDFIPFKQTTLTLSTAELEDAFSEAGTDTITPTLEIELSQGGTPKTIYQGGVTIRKDLITVGSSVPGPQASYYTKSEVDALFVEDLSTGVTGSVDAANHSLRDLSAVKSIDWRQRTLFDSAGGSVITYGAGLGHTATCLGFYSTTPTAQPTNTNVLSALVDVGLIATTVTLGNVVSQSIVNVDASGQALYSGGQQSINWAGRALRNSNGTTVAFWNSTALSIGQSAAPSNLVLVDSSSINSISFGQSFGSKIGTATAQKIGFWNATPVTQPNQDNVVTALRGCGLLAGGPGVSTYGILPLSSKTLTTTATIDFGTLNGHAISSGNVTITGASVGDVVLFGLPSVVSNGPIIQGVVFATNTVCVSAINGSNNSQVLGSGTYRITVIGY